MQWSLLDFDGYVPDVAVSPPPRSERQISFPSIELYDQTRAARALLDRFLTGAYEDARTVWNDNRDTLGPVYEYPEETCYSPTRAQARVDKFLHTTDLLSQETRLRRPLKLPVPEPTPESIPIPRSTVWRELGLMIHKSPHTFIHQTLPRLLSSQRALAFPLIKRLSPKAFRKRKDSKKTLAIEEPEPAAVPPPPPPVVEVRRLYRANSVIEPMITAPPSQVLETIPTPAVPSTVVTKKRRRNTIDEGQMACAEQRRVGMGATPRVTLPLPSRSALPPRLWPSVSHLVTPPPRRLSLTEIDRLPPPPGAVLPQRVPAFKEPVPEKEMKSVISSLWVLILIFVVALGIALFNFFIIARFLSSLFSFFL